MTRYLDTLNRVRQHASPQWLTPSQRIAYRLLRERLGFLDEVNLWGAHGVGKTFVAWVMVREGLTVYAPLPEEMEPASVRRTIVVDNMSWQRSRVRDVLNKCRDLGYRKVVLITTEPAQDQISTIELLLDGADIEAVKANLRSAGISPRNDEPRNLWDLLIPAGVAWE